MPDRRSRSRLLDRAIVLAVADLEREGADWADEAGSPESAGLDDDAALVARAHRIATRTGIESGVRRAIDARRLLWPAATIAGVLAGASAAWAGLAGGGDPTQPGAADLNVLWFLQITLGVHTVFFVLALAAMALALLRATHPLAGMLRACVRRIAAAAASKETLGARAAASAILGGRRGALFAGALGHAAGLGFVAGALAALLVAASFREQYRFFWKSTLLSDGQAAALIDAVAGGPRAIGLPAPSPTEIAQARAGVTTAQADNANAAEWAWMLVGALLVWGAAPRLLALAASLTAAAWLTANTPLPISESYRQRALQRERRPRDEGSVPRVPDALDPPAPSAPEDGRPDGAPVLLAYELDGYGRWPPRGVGGWTDLGLIDGAADRRRVLGDLDAAPTRPRALVAFFSRGETPAVAERDFLRELVARAGARTAVALTLGNALATERDDRDPERIARRTDLWRHAAEHAGVPSNRIIELDLSHLTETTLARLKTLADEHGTGNAVHSATHQAGALRAALDDIERWAGAADHSDAALGALLERIDGRFGREPAWRRAAGAITAGDLGAARDAVTQSAGALKRLLPGWMPSHPGWMSATAALVTTGTLSAVLLAGGPIGFAAGLWPLYAAVGAAMGEAGGRAADALRREPRDDDAAARGARAAVLHTLVLSLQGMGDEHVARTIDAVLRDAPDTTRAADVPRLIAHVRRRLAETDTSEGTTR